MTVETQVLVDNLEVGAKAFRRAFAASLGAPVGSFAGGVGARHVAHGVVSPADLVVTQAGTPAMKVQVAAGLASIVGTVSAEQGPYAFYNDAALELTIAAANPTNPRRDLVVAQVRDAVYGGLDTDARLVVVQGTPAASPSDPSLSAHPNALVLARVTVAAGATSITNANITDLRTLVGASVGWEVSRTATVSVTSGAPTDIPFDGEPWDPWGMHSAGTVTITSATEGVYTMGARLGLTAAWTEAANEYVAINVSGVGLFSAKPQSGQAMASIATPPIYLPAGTTVTARLYHLAGSARSVDTTSRFYGHRLAGRK